MKTRGGDARNGPPADAGATPWGVAQKRQSEIPEMRDAKFPSNSAGNSKEQMTITISRITLIISAGGKAHGGLRRPVMLAVGWRSGSWHRLNYHPCLDESEAGVTALHQGWKVGQAALTGEWQWPHKATFEVSHRDTGKPRLCSF